MITYYKHCPLFIITFVNEKNKQIAIGVTTNKERIKTLKWLKKNKFSWAVTVINGAKNNFK